MKRLTVIAAVLAMCVAVTATAKQSEKASSKRDFGWTQLSLRTCGVDAFLNQFPNADGRGVVIAVLDTGVDPGIPGLTEMPGGGPKVIDVQDFTGEGDVEMSPVQYDKDAGEVTMHDKDGAPVAYPLPELPNSDANGGRKFWMGRFKERTFVNSDVSDLNDNGETNDEWAVLLTAMPDEGDEQALVYIDTNLDRSFADEKPLHSYRINQDTFTFGRDKPESQIEPVTMAINVLLKKRKVVVHFDDGAHGTHVAGIAAGYRINNQEGFNGVAPGAKVMSLKIGQNAVGGISTTSAIADALEYAAKYMRETGTPVVCNLSYGIDSVLEGSTSIDKRVDEILAANPGLVFCTSAGNDGPGLSTVGTPAAADWAISVGALLAADSARDVQGYAIDEAIPTVFTSRGGELDKPDIATPGWSTSTVPRWVTRGDYWAGTSMASPYASGLCALLISEAMQTHSDTLIPSRQVKLALKNSASMPTWATAVDVGHGTPNLSKASSLLDDMLEEGDDVLIGYDISTPSPIGDKGRSTAAYWRSPWFPKDEPQTFTVSPVFAPTTDATNRTGFARKFELRSNTPWCKVDQESVYLRSEQSTDIFVNYDADALTEPGLYVGTVDALYNGRVEFRLVSVITVPCRYSIENKFAQRFTGHEVKGWDPERYFLAVPAGASAMHLEMTAPDDEQSQAGFQRIFDPNGRQLRSRGARLDPENGRRQIDWTITEDLIPGVWEIDVVADRPDRTWRYDFATRFFGIQSSPATITEWDGSGELTVTNVFEEPLAAQVDGRIEGFRQHKTAKFEGLKDTVTYTVKLDERFSGARFKLEFAPKAYAEATDVGVRVLDSSGEALAANAFSNRMMDMQVSNPTPGKETTLKLEIIGGFAVVDEERKTEMDVKIDYLLDNPVSLDVERGGSSSMTLVPGIPVVLEYEADGVLPAAPDGTEAVGYIRIRERSSNTEALRVVIDPGAE